MPQRSCRRAGWPRRGARERRGRRARARRRASRRAQCVRRRPLATSRSSRRTTRRRRPACGRTASPTARATSTAGRAGVSVERAYHCAATRQRGARRATPRSGRRREAWVKVRRPRPRQRRRCFRFGQTRNHASRRFVLRQEVSRPDRRTCEVRQDLTPVDYSPVHARDRCRSGVLAFPVLDKEPGRSGAASLRIARRRPSGLDLPVRIVLFAFVSIASLSIVVGLFVTHVLLRVHGVAGADESLVRFLADHRSSGLTDASLIGSIIAGGVVLPIVAGVAALVAAASQALAARRVPALRAGRRVRRRIGRRRSSSTGIGRMSHRLEKLPVDASYPSGHTAAAIAVYCGLALLLTSRISAARRRWRSGSSPR